MRLGGALLSHRLGTTDLKQGSRYPWRVNFEQNYQLEIESSE